MERSRGRQPDVSELSELKRGAANPSADDEWPPVRAGGAAVWTSAPPNLVSPLAIGDGFRLSGALSGSLKRKRREGPFNLNDGVREGTIIFVHLRYAAVGYTHSFRHLIGPSHP